MFERPRRGERAIIVHVGMGRAPNRITQSEFESLADAAGAETVARLIARVRTPNPRYLLGSGKLEELRRAPMSRTPAWCWSTTT